MIMHVIVSRGDAPFADDPKSFKPVRIDIEEAEAAFLLQSKCSSWHVAEVRPSTGQTGDAVRIKPSF